MSEWISVKDRLPDGNGSYLVWSVADFEPSYGGWEIAMFLVEEKRWHFSAVDSDITHWQPLPAPPEVRPPRRWRKGVMPEITDG